MPSTRFNFHSIFIRFRFDFSRIKIAFDFFVRFFKNELVRFFFDFTLVSRMDFARINQFIESYRQNEMLWNVHCPDYHNRVKRKEAIARLANEYDISGKL